MFSIIKMHYTKSKNKASFSNHENENDSAYKVKLGSKRETGDHVQSTIFIIKEELQLSSLNTKKRIRTYLSSQLAIIDASSVSESKALTESSVNLTFNRQLISANTNFIPQHVEFLFCLYLTSLPFVSLSQL